MNDTIMNHMNECFDELLNPVKTYRITIKKDGVKSEWTAKGRNMNEAENSIQAYVGSNIYFLSCRDITNVKDGE